MLAHRDVVEGRPRSLGHLGGTWYDLGRAAGTVAAGLQRIVLPPGTWSTPAHVHGRNEEIFFVLRGTGVSWQDGDAYEIGAGDCPVHLAGGAAHTLRAGGDGLDVLAFGTRAVDDVALYPRSNRLFWRGLGVIGGIESLDDDGGEP